MHRALEQRNHGFKIARSVFADHGYSFDAKLISLLPNVRRCITVSFFDSTRPKPFEIFPGCQDLVKYINPVNAAILAVYWPAAYLDELTRIPRD